MKPDQPTDRQAADDKKPGCQLVGRSPETPSQSEKEWRSRQLRPQWCLFWAAVVTGIIGVYTLFVLKDTLDATKDAADAAKRSADTAALQFDLSQRPWIEFQPENTVTLSRDGAGRWDGLLTAMVKNHGESVAKNVGHWLELFPVNSAAQFETAERRQRQWCDENRHPKSSFVTGDNLFPKGNYSVRTGLGIAEKDITSQTMGLAIVGCVIYRAAYDPPDRPTRQTRFAYLLSMTAEGRLGLPGATKKPTTFYLLTLPALTTAD